MSSIQKAYEIAQKRYDATEHPHFYAPDEPEWIKCECCPTLLHPNDVIFSDGLCEECREKFDLIMGRK